MKNAPPSRLLSWAPALTLVSRIPNVIRSRLQWPDAGGDGAGFRRQTFARRSVGRHRLMHAEQNRTRGAYSVVAGYAVVQAHAPAALW